MGTALPEYKVGKSTFILALTGAIQERHRLVSMGLVPGAEIKVISKGPSGLLVALGKSRIGLEPEMAQGIVVS
ncbi:MAG: ferrous iron transport protein A [Deltaproteobacteria bacterium]|jgi:Fe2+ transport system protein FeoA|nr:ferrous iron transport protein A [Deltaproteobacteria bacterium]